MLSYNLYEDISSKGLVDGAWQIDLIYRSIP